MLYKVIILSGLIFVLSACQPITQNSEFERGACVRHILSDSKGDDGIVADVYIPGYNKQPQYRVRFSPKEEPITFFEHELERC